MEAVLREGFLFKSGIMTSELFGAMNETMLQEKRWEGKKKWRLCGCVRRKKKKGQ
jgi:hypothetical protein